MGRFKFREPSTAAGAIVFCAVLALCVARIAPVGSVFGVDAGAAQWVMTDFYSGGYYPVRALVEGGNPYDREQFMATYPVADGFPPYLPATLILHLPFGLMPPGIAAASYFAVTIVLTLLLAWTALVLAAGRGAASRGRVLMLAAMILVSRPGHWNLMAGQRTLIYVLGTYASLRFMNERPRLAGLGLALAMIKPTFGVPVAVMLLAAGAFTSVVWGAVITVAGSAPLLPVMVGRAGGVRPFIASLLQGFEAWQGVREIDPTTSLFRIELPAALSRWVGRDIGPEASSAIAALLLCIGVVAVYRLTRDRGRIELSRVAAVVCSTVLLYVQHVGYDLLLLAWPCVAFFAACSPVKLERRPVPLLLAACYLAVIFNWLATWSFTRAVAPQSSWWVFIASINTVAVFGIWLVSIAAAFARRGATTRVIEGEALPQGHG